MTAINRGSYLALHKQPNYSGGEVPGVRYGNGALLALACWTTGSGDIDGHGDRYWFSVYDPDNPSRTGYANDYYLTTGSSGQWMGKVSQCPRASVPGAPPPPSAVDNDVSFLPTVVASTSAPIPAPETAHHEPDSAPHGSHKRNPAAMLYYRSERAAVWVGAEFGRRHYGWTHAADLLEHFLRNSGATVTLSVDELLAEKADVRGQFDRHLGSDHAALRDWVCQESQRNGGRAIVVPFRTAWFGAYPGGGVADDWNSTLGHFSMSVTGIVRAAPGARSPLSVTYRAHLYDRYNWDRDEDLDPPGPGRISQGRLAALHEVGIAQYFDVRGDSAEMTLSLGASS